MKNLSDHEQGIVEAARCGVLVSLAPDVELEELATSNDLTHQVRAELIRELLLGRHGELDPRGVRLEHARVVGALDLDHVRTAVPLVLVQCSIIEPFTARNARIGELDLEGSRLSILHADNIRIDGDLVLNAARVQSDNKNGAIRLTSAHVGGQFDCKNVKITNDVGPALIADRIRVDNTLVLESAEVRGTGEIGALSLMSAQIGGQFDCENIEIINESGTALDIELLRVDGALFLRGAKVRGTGTNGAVRLPNAHVTSQVNCEAVEIVNDAGPALRADSIRIEESLVLDQARVRGSGADGAINLMGAHVGWIFCRDAEVVNDTGSAMDLGALRVDNDVDLSKATLVGDDELGAVCFPDARIGARLICVDLEVDNPSGPVLNLEKLSVEGAVLLPVEVVCAYGGRGDDCQHANRINLNEFVFTTLSWVDWRQWLHLITYHTEDYQPRSYQLLAAAERAAGHDGNARHVLIAQQDDLRRRDPSALGGRWIVAVHGLWGKLAGYGYRTRTLALALLLALAAAGSIGYVAGQISTRPGHYAAERVSPLGSPTTAATRCSTVELIGLGLDRGLPLGATGLRSKCDLDTATRRGQAITLAIWIIQAMLWGLITLAVAGYTNLIRKTP
jgi:hypothetical protein